MAEILLFHHAQGLTGGIVSFADTLREAGHRVHTPDLYSGKTFAGLDEAVARELVQAIPGAELFVYDAKGHLFADSSLAAYDKKDTELLTARVLSFLKNL